MGINFRYNGTTYTPPQYTSGYAYPGYDKLLYFRKSDNNCYAYLVKSSQQLIGWMSSTSFNYYNPSLPAIHCYKDGVTYHTCNSTITPSVVINYAAKYYSSSDGDLSIKSVTLSHYFPMDFNVTVRHVGCSENKSFTISKGTLSYTTETTLTSGKDGVKRFYLEVTFGTPGGEVKRYYPLSYTSTSNSYTYKTITVSWSSFSSTSPTS